MNPALRPPRPPPTVRARPRARARARWFPPGNNHFGSAAFGAGGFTATGSTPAGATGLYDRFRTATFAEDDIFANAGAAVPTTGTGLVLSSPSSEVVTRTPIDLYARSVSWEWTLSSAFLADTTAAAGVSIGVPGSAFIVTVEVRYIGGGWKASTYITVGAADVTTETATTTGAEWRWVRVSSNPANPAEIKIWRSATGLTWTLVTTATIPQSDTLRVVEMTMYANGA